MPSKTQRTEIDSQALLMEMTVTVGEKELRKILRNRKEIVDKAQQGQLEPLALEVGAMLTLVKDYVKGDYRKVPFGTVAAIGGALLYLLSPNDLIPDFIPGVGYLDDAGVVMACLRLVRMELDRHLDWRRKQTGKAKRKAA